MQIGAKRDEKRGIKRHDDETDLRERGEKEEWRELEGGNGGKGGRGGGKLVHVLANQLDSYSRYLSLP